MVYTRRTRYPARRRKRWYVSAGANLPYLGKTSLSIGNQKRSLVSKVRKALLEPKLNSQLVTGGASAQQTLYTWNPFAQITQGTTYGLRIGDAIHAKYATFKWSGVFDFGTIAAVAPNTKQAGVRIMVIQMREEYNPAPAAFGSGVGSTDVFLQNTDPFHSFTDKTRDVTILCDKTFFVKNDTAVSTATIEKTFVLSCKLNKKFQYADSNGIYGKYKNIYVVYIPFAAGTVTGTTTVVNGVSMNSMIGFTE